MTSPNNYEPFTIRLPEPYTTTYEAYKSSKSTPEQLVLQIRRSQPGPNSLPEGIPPPEQLENDSLFVTRPEATTPDAPRESDNTAWGRARRSPLATFDWTGSQAPTLAQSWLALYVLLEQFPHLEQFRLNLTGSGAEQLKEQLCTVMLAVEHPLPIVFSSIKTAWSPLPGECIVLRSAFWQGAGSPFGTRPVWLPEQPFDGPKPLSTYPPMPLDYMQTTSFPEGRVHTRHLRRPAKPRPGSVIYSRYIPHLREHFSMVQLDIKNEEHLNLFHRWQNDPRVAQGWNQSGTMEEHIEYLTEIHNDPHQMAVLAKFDNTFFAYYEIYWAQEDNLGAYHRFQPHDRGRHSLVGDVRFRGPHRVAMWWAAILHYIFLDEPRTMRVVGEPKATNATVLAYDFANGFAVHEWVDLPHKRSALMVCPRERFFQLAPMAYDGVVKGADGLNPMARL